MRIIDTGVLCNSFMEFSIPSDFARSALFYVPQFGHFFCTDGYDIRRESLGLFLLICVSDGMLTIETQGRSYMAAEGQIVLLDCRQPHRYYCTQPTEFLWFHFCGGSSAQYADYLFEQGGVAFSGEHIPYLRQHFDFILTHAQLAFPNEHAISLHVSQILGYLATPQQRTSVLNPLLSPATDYIGAHYAETIELDTLAAQCSLSTSHFIRSFKKNLNCTPHEYLLSYRLKQAKQLLVTTSRSVEQIAEQCGFNSASHFARAFRKSNGMSPSAFRMMQF